MSYVVVSTHGRHGGCASIRILSWVIIATVAVGVTIIPALDKVIKLVHIRDISRLCVSTYPHAG
jgi:hypothetical protein